MYTYQSVNLFVLYLINDLKLLIQERERKRQQEYEEALKEKLMVDEVVRKIYEEDQRLVLFTSKTKQKTHESMTTTAHLVVLFLVKALCII